MAAQPTWHGVAREVEKACKRGWYDHLREKDLFGRFMAGAQPELRRLVHAAERRAAAMRRG